MNQPAFGKKGIECNLLTVDFELETWSVCEFERVDLELIDVLEIGHALSQPDNAVLELIHPALDLVHTLS